MDISGKDTVHIKVANEPNQLYWVYSKRTPGIHHNPSYSNEQTKYTCYKEGETKESGTPFIFTNKDIVEILYEQ